MLSKIHSAVLLVVCVLLSLSGPARAHDTALSGIRIVYRDQDVIVNAMTPISRLLRAEGRTALTPVELDRAVRRRLHLRFDGRDLLPKNVNVIGDNANDILSWQTIVTITAKECEVLARLYPEDAQSRTVVTIMWKGQAVQETLLDAAHPSLLHNQPKPRASAVALRYVREGIDHIFGGPDHILFVLGLLLLGGSLKSLLKTVTAFTLAHSITLTLAATGILAPSPRLIEPLIALSIVAIAIDNLRTMRRERTAVPADSPPAPPRDLRPYYAFGFGLIHGFGFASALAEVGLPRTALVVALASFNIGVEIGQATIVLLTAPVLAWFARKQPVWYLRSATAGAVFIGLAGSYWFITRLFPSP